MCGVKHYWDQTLHNEKLYACRTENTFPQDFLEILERISWRNVSSLSWTNGGILQQSTVSKHVTFHLHIWLSICIHSTYDITLYKISFQKHLFQTLLKFAMKCLLGQHEASFRTLIVLVSKIRITKRSSLIEQWSW